MQIYTRTPTLTAMTAAGLDHVSGGRFTLGIGASGPQVVEGFHGVAYDAPLARTRELVEICRQVWRREKVEHQGRYYRVPLPSGSGTGLGKPLRLIDTPLRARIPVVLAAIGPKNVALAAEVAEGWQPISYYPEKAADVWGPAPRDGLSRRDPDLGPLDVVVGMRLAIGDDVAGLVELGRPQLALYIGGMGARSKNFYNDLARHYGYEREAQLMQDLYLAGRKEEAAAAVPEELLRATCLVGPLGDVQDRLQALRAAGVTTLNLTPVAPDHARRLQDMETVKQLVA